MAEIAVRSYSPHGLENLDFFFLSIQITFCYFYTSMITWKRRDGIKRQAALHALVRFLGALPVLSVINAKSSFYALMITGVCFSIITFSPMQMMCLCDKVLNM